MSYLDQIFHDFCIYFWQLLIKQRPSPGTPRKGLERAGEAHQKRKRRWGRSAPQNIMVRIMLA